MSETVIQDVVSDIQVGDLVRINEFGYRKGPKWFEKERNCIYLVLDIFDIDDQRGLLEGCVRKIAVALLTSTAKTSEINLAFLERV